MLLLLMSSFPGKLVIETLTGYNIVEEILALIIIINIM